MLNFSMLAWDKSIKDLYFWDNDKRIEINVPNGAPSRVYEAPINTPLTFYRNTGQIDENGNPIGIPLASINITSADKPLLLIFFEKPNQAGTYSIASIVNETQTSANDIYQLYNISNHNIIAKFNDQNITLSPNESLIIPAPETDKPSFGVMMAIQLDSQDSGEIQLVYKAFWPYRKGRSSLVFISDDKKSSDQIIVRRFYVTTNEQ